MFWNYPFSAVEYWGIACFGVAYAVYIGRTVLIARQLRSTNRAVFLKFFLRSVYLSLLVVSLLGPSFGEAAKDVLAEGRDIIMVTDVSKSMIASDVAPSRLEKVKFEIQRVADALPTDRLGLVCFSGMPFLQVPLTFDHSAFQLLLQMLSTNQTSSEGTDVCAALELATQKHLSSKANEHKSKVIVLFTDGENFGSCASSVGNKIRQYGLSLYVVGVGTDRGSVLKTGTVALKTADGSVVVSKLNRAFLQKVAATARGKYYEITDRHSDVPELIESIRGIEARLVDGRQVSVSSNKYYYFLGIALLLVLFDLTFMVRIFEL